MVPLSDWVVIVVRESLFQNVGEVTEQAAPAVQARSVGASWRPGGRIEVDLPGRGRGVDLTGPESVFDRGQDAALGIGAVGRAAVLLGVGVSLRRVEERLRVAVRIDDVVQVVPPRQTAQGGLAAAFPDRDSPQAVGGLVT